MKRAKFDSGFHLSQLDHIITASYEIVLIIEKQKNHIEWGDLVNSCIIVAVKNFLQL